MAKSRRGGFSLLELLVSLTIIGIVIATVAPRIGRSMSRTRVQRASTVIASDIKRAFALAAQRRSPVRLSFDTAGKSMAIRNRAADTTFFSNSFTSNSEIGLTQLQASRLVIFVFPNGLADFPDTITATTPGGNRRRVIFTRAGQVRISEP